VACHNASVNLKISNVRKVYAPTSPPEDANCPIFMQFDYLKLFVARDYS